MRLFADVTGQRLTVLNSVLTPSDVVTDVPTTDTTWFPVPPPMVGSGYSGYSGTT